MSRASTYGLDTGPATGLDWRRRGACTQTDPDLWTSPSWEDLGRARWICLRACPVKADCLAWAQQHPAMADQAVYGGLYWTRRTSDAGNPIGVARPSDVQPIPRPPDDRPARRRPEQRDQPHVRLLPHVDEIRALYAAGVPTIDIARRYGCSDDAIRSFAARNGIHRPERAA